MTHQAAATKQGSSRFKFIGETIGELKKVVWLSRREALYLTFLVLVVAIVAALVLGFLDLGFARLFELVLPGG